jgi:hypothetical protein
LLAIPHYVVLWTAIEGGGLIGLLVLDAVVTLLVTDGYPRDLFD